MRILYIGGFGRSGTTLLNRMLGELPNVCAVGETVNLWRQGVLNNEQCGCGSAFYSCPFWQEVGKLAFGGWSLVDLDHVLALRSSMSRLPHVREASLAPTSLAGSVSGTIRSRIEANNTLYWRLYSAISQVSGCAVIVDASKHAALASLLRHHEPLDIRLVHMIRDSRGVAYSWTKQKLRFESGAQASFMDRFSTFQSALLWNSYNVSLSTLRRLGVPYTRVRYEDLVSAPGRYLREIAQMAKIQVDDDALLFLNDGYVYLKPAHTVAGNPMRFQSGRIAIGEDDAWKTRLSMRNRIVVTTLTLPLLVRFGYLPSQGGAMA